MTERRLSGFFAGIKNTLKYRDKNEFVDVRPACHSDVFRAKETKREIFGLFRGDRFVKMKLLSNWPLGPRLKAKSHEKIRRRR